MRQSWSHIGVPLVVCGLFAGVAWSARGEDRHRGGEAAQLRVEVNLAASQVNVYDGDQRIRSYVASVGMPQYQTPVGNYSITSVVFNPSWTPPAEPWAAGQEPRAPGPENPMGRVKLNFAPGYFIHGTPAEAQLGQPVSHGCVRLSNSDAIELARMVVRAGAPGVSDREIDAILANPSDTRTIPISDPVPVSVVRG